MSAKTMRGQADEQSTRRNADANGNGRLPGVLADLAATQRQIDRAEARFRKQVRPLREQRARQIRAAILDGRRPVDIARALDRSWARAKQIINAASSQEDEHDE